ncbi:MAG: glycosyltransferase family 2 protein [Casimicrobium sp.]
MKPGMRGDITPVILTFNEAPNIERTLLRLTWALRVVVLDSGSTDDTVAICEKFSNAEVFTRKFTEHAEQWNFALTQTNIASDWVLALDADYVLSDELIEEIASLDLATTNLNGYWALFRYCVQGKVLRASLYPDVVVLFRRRSGTNYVQDGHTQRLAIEGEIGRLRGSILHDDRKPLSRWLQSQDRYAALECDHLIGVSGDNLSWQDKLRRMMFIAPFLVPIYCLFARGLIFDGWAGLHYTLQRTIAEAILSIKLIERRIFKK